MEETNQPKKRTIITIALITAIALLSSLAFSYYKFQNKDVLKTDSTLTPAAILTPTIESANKEIKIILIGQSGEAKAYDFAGNEGETAFELLKRFDAEKEDFTMKYTEYSFGPFVSSINDFEPDAAKQFWTFEVNGKPSEVGVGEYKIKKGDIIQFKLQNIE